jgi:hypothetical protein
MPIAVFFAGRGHAVYRVSSASAADLRRFLHLPLLLVRHPGDQLAELGRADRQQGTRIGGARAASQRDQETDRKGQPMSKAGPSLLRATLFRAADTARRQDPRPDLLPADDRARRHSPQGLLRRRRPPRRARLDHAEPRHPLRDLRQQRKSGHR